MLRFTMAVALVASASFTQGYVDRLSRTASDLPANADSTAAALSGDGRVAAFVSSATNLVPGDTNGRRDVFVRVRMTGVVERVSISTSGVQQDLDAVGAPAVSGDGRYVIFSSASNLLVASDTNGQADVFLRDRLLGATVRVSVTNSSGEAAGGSVVAGISSDGRHVLFQSNANNLATDDTNGVDDLFLRDRLMGTTTRVSVGSGGVQSDMAAQSGALSANGRFVAWQTMTALFDPGDQNSAFDVYVRDLETGVTTRASQPAFGGTSNGHSVHPSVANDGTVAFRTAATSLFTGDTNGLDDIVVAYLGVAGCTPVSVASDDSLSNGPNSNPSISADGLFVAFASVAANLCDGDTNGIPDVFVRDLMALETLRVSGDVAGALPQAPTVCTAYFGCLPLQLAPRIASGGGSVAFEHIAQNLTPVFDVDYIRDVFAVDLFPRVRRLPGPSGVASVVIEAPADVGRGFVGGLSLSYRPGITLGARVIPLGDDGLLSLTLGSADVPWIGFSGVVPPTGVAFASFPVPNDPWLSGVSVYFSFATLGAADPFGVHSIANTMPVALGM